MGAESAIMKLRRPCGSFHVRISDLSYDSLSLAPTNSNDGTGNEQIQTRIWAEASVVDAKGAASQSFWCGVDQEKNVTPFVVIGETVVNDKSSPFFALDKDVVRRLAQSHFRCSVYYQAEKPTTSETHSAGESTLSKTSVAKGTAASKSKVDSSVDQADKLQKVEEKNGYKRIEIGRVEIPFDEVLIGSSRFDRRVQIEQSTLNAETEADRNTEESNTFGPSLLNAAVHVEIEPDVALFEFCNGLQKVSVGDVHIDCIQAAKRSGNKIQEQNNDAEAAASNSKTTKDKEANSKKETKCSPNSKDQGAAASELDTAASLPRIEDEEFMLRFDLLPPHFSLSFENVKATKRNQAFSVDDEDQDTALEEEAQGERALTENEERSKKDGDSTKGRSGQAERAKEESEGEKEKENNVAETLALAHQGEYEFKDILLQGMERSLYLFRDEFAALEERAKTASRIQVAVERRYRAVPDTEQSSSTGKAAPGKAQAKSLPAKGEKSSASAKEIKTDKQVDKCDKEEVWPVTKECVGVFTVDLKGLLTPDCAQLRLSAEMTKTNHQEKLCEGTANLSLDSLSLSDQEKGGGEDKQGDRKSKETNTGEDKAKGVGEDEQQVMGPLQDRVTAVEDDFAPLPTLHFTLSLSDCFVHSETQSLLQKSVFSLADIVPQRPPAKPFPKNEALNEFKTEIKTIARLIMEERGKILPKQRGEDAEEDPEGEEDYEEARKTLLRHLNKEQIYHSFKENLKGFVVRLLQEKQFVFDDARTNNEEERETALFAFVMQQANSALAELFAEIESIEEPRLAVTEPNDLSVLLKRAEEAEISGDVDKAKILLRRRIKTAQTFFNTDGHSDALPLTWFEYAKFALRHNELAEGTIALEECLALDSVFCPALLLLACAYTTAKEIEKARTMLQTLLDLEQSRNGAPTVRSHLALSLFYHTSGLDVSGKMTNIEIYAAIRNSSDFPSASNNNNNNNNNNNSVKSTDATHTMRKTQQPHSEEQSPEQNTSKDDEDNVQREREADATSISRILLDFSLFLLDSGLVDLGGSCLQLAEKFMKPLEVGSHSRLQLELLKSSLAVQSKDFEEAELRAKSALVIDDSSVDAWMAAAKAQREQGKLEDARSSLLSALSLYRHENPSSEAKACSALELPSESLSAFVSPPPLRLLLDLGALLLQLSDVDQALQLYLCAVRTHEECSLCWLGLGVALLRAERVAEAEQALAEANVLDYGNEEAWGYLALVCLHATPPRLEEAELALKEAIRYNLRSASLLRELGTMYTGLGHLDVAEGLLRRSLEAQDSTTTRKRLAEVLQAQNCSAEAMTLVQT